MTEPEFTTVFTFVCSRCRQPNEYRQVHAAWVRPHLVSTKCSKCHSLNSLGGIRGRLLPPELSPSSLNEVVVGPSDGGSKRAAKKVPD
jgi:hypothetical protein